jgi:hypothetical protein
MRSGMILGLAAWAGWFLVIFYQSGPSDVWERVLCWPTTWAFLMMVVSWLVLPRTSVGWWMLLRRATFVLLGILAAEICLAITCYPEYSSGGSWVSRRAYEDVAVQIGGILSLLAAGGIAGTLLGTLAAREASPTTYSMERTPYSLRCPRCGTHQSAMTGPHHCQHCRLLIRVELI